MKKYIVAAIIVVLVVLTLPLSVFGQPSNRGPGLEALEDPSLARPRGPRGGPLGFLNVESTNKAVQAIEEQIAAIKKAMEGAEPIGGPGRPGGPGPGGDFRTMMEQMAKRTEAVQAATAVIAEQVLVLKGRQARIEFQEEINKLQSIVSSAKAEQATKTVQLVQSIIDARQKMFQETAERLGIPVPRGRRGRGGPDAGPSGRMGGGEPPIKGGFEWID